MLFIHPWHPIWRDQKLPAATRKGTSLSVCALQASSIETNVLVLYMNAMVFAEGKCRTVHLIEARISPQIHAHAGHIYKLQAQVLKPLM